MEIIICIILVALFWRLFAGLAILCAAILAPVLAALITYGQTQSGYGALVAAGLVVAWIVAAIVNADDRTW